MRLISSFFTLFVLLLLVTSCEENEEAGEYDNWQGLNVAYVDSIANLANNAIDGWSKIKSYTLRDDLGDNAGNKCYIYVKKLENGEGEYKPQDEDSVRVHYCGRLILTEKQKNEGLTEGTVFDKSYSGATLNEEIDVPALMRTIGTVPGFATALESMVQGDRWTVVIPSYLGYGSNSNSSIPANSTLIFDLKLARIYRYKIDTDTSWH